MSRIVWGEPMEHPERRGWWETHGYIGGLRVATIRPCAPIKDGRWWVTVHLSPLPERLDAMTMEPKASEKQAKSTAQRVVNAYLKILNGQDTA